LTGAPGKSRTSDIAKRRFDDGRGFESHKPPRAVRFALA
jgi:hypothetical protein